MAHRKWVQKQDATLDGKLGLQRSDDVLRCYSSVSDRCGSPSRAGPKIAISAGGQKGLRWRITNEVALPWTRFHQQSDCPMDELCAPGSALGTTRSEIPFSTLGKGSGFSRCPRCFILGVYGAVDLGDMIRLMPAADSSVGNLLRAFTLSGANGGSLYDMDFGYKDGDRVYQVLSPTLVPCHYFSRQTFFG